MREVPDAAEANRLYWETEASVADIAARFDLSRRALYEAVEPLDARAMCAECGGDLVFENRLARRTGNALCLQCGEHEELSAAAVADMRRPEVQGIVERTDARQAAVVADFRHVDDRSGDLRNRAVLLGSAAIAGMAIGGVAAWLARRRD
jgi:hypothetical protein